MKFKIESNWGSKLVSEDGWEIKAFNVIPAKDLSTGKNVYLLGSDEGLRGHGEGGSVFKISVICAETDQKLNNWDINGNVYERDFTLDISVTINKKGGL